MICLTFCVLNFGYNLMVDHEVNDDNVAKEQPHKDQGDDSETEVEKAKNVRTYTLCKEILALKAQGLKKKLEVNHLGQLIGRSSITFETYIGYLVRIMFPINIPTWKDVPGKVMDELRGDVIVIQ